MKQHTFYSLVIVDRDGVINYDSAGYIKSPAEWQAIPGSLEGITALNQAGFKVVVASNQAGIGRGLFDLTALDQIHQKMTNELAKLGGRVDGIFFCPHHPDDQCNCRKPKPGLLLQIAEYFNLPIDSAYYIGDSLKDIQAAQAVKCTPILVKTGNGLQTLNALPTTTLIKVFDNLHAACDAIINDKV